MLLKRVWLSLILLIFVLLVIALIVLSQLPGKQQGSSYLSEMFAPRAHREVSVSVLNFDTGRSRVFAHAEGSVAAAGTLGVQVLGPDGRETFRDSFSMSAPAIIESNGRFAAFDIGGSALRIFNAEERLAQVETEGIIVSASINKNGWFCVVTQEQMSGSRGTVAVYNDNGRQVYQIIMGSGFALSAKLSDDNKNLAVLSVLETGSRIALYSGIDTDKDEPDLLYNFYDEILIDIEYLTNTSVLTVGTQAVMTVAFFETDPINTLYRFDDKRLGGYTHSSDFTALHLYDYNIGYSGDIISLDVDGTVLGQFETSHEIASISSYGNTLVLLSNDGITFFDKHLVAYPPSDSTDAMTTAGRVLALSEDMALGASDLSAIVVRRGER